jgi:hypothetical protein
MRTPDFQQTQVIASSGGSRLVRLRVKVKDSGGTFRDLTTYPGIDMVSGATWRESMDDKGITSEVRLIRSQNAISLAPLFLASPLNHAFNPSSAFAPMLAPFREVRVEWAVIPDTVTAPGAGDWYLGFHGRIDKVSWPDGQVILECRDLSSLLQDRFLEVERVYSYAQGTAVGCRIWQPNTDYSAGEYVIPTTAKLNGHFYGVNAAGTSGSTEPAWLTGSHAVFTDGGIDWEEWGLGSATAGTPVETCMQAILDDTFGVGAITLNVPVSPAWNVKWWQQKRGSVLDALRTLAEQIGWDVRYLYDSASSSYKLTLWGPPRTKTTPDRTWGPGEIVNLSTLEQSLEAIRNVIRVTYSDSATLDSKGVPMRKVVTVTDSASVTAFGRRWMEIQEASASNIDTSTEANTMANAVLSDLALPNVDLSVEVLFFPWAELGDLYRFLPDGWRYTQQQDLALVSYEHTVNENKARTTFDVRGKPSGGYLRWLGKAGELNPEDVHFDVVATTATPLTVRVAGVVGGTIIQASNITGKNVVPEGYEFHVSRTAGFLPDSSTIKGSGLKPEVTVTDLVPGKQYYTRTVPFVYNAQRIVQGQPSDEVGFTAGRASAGHYSSVVSQAHFPLNGNFEHALDDLATNPPDHWSMVLGTWGSGGDAYYGTDAVYGRYLSLRVPGDPQIRSSPFPVRRGMGRANVYLSVRQTGTAGASRGLTMYFRFYSLADLSDTPVLYTFTVPNAYAAINTWATYIIDSNFFGITPPAANFCTVTFGKESTSTAFGWDVGDIFFCEGQQEAWHVNKLYVPNGGLIVESWSAPSYSNNWTSIGGANQTGRYLREPSGFVCLSGAIWRSTGTPSANETIFNLPSGYRPAASLIFPVITDTGLGRVDVANDGRVIYVSGGWGFLSLESLRFDTR